MAQNPSFVAHGADIKVSRFVSIVAGQDKRVAVSADGAVAQGISHEGSYFTELPGSAVATKDLIAIPENLSGRVYGIGDECALYSSVAIPAGSFIKPGGTDGRAAVALTGERYSAVALNEVTAADEIVRVQVLRGTAP